VLHAALGGLGQRVLGGGEAVGERTSSGGEAEAGEGLATGERGVHARRLWQFRGKCNHASRPGAPASGLPWRRHPGRRTGPMSLQDLTALCHHLLRPCLKPGAWVVDATAGNGHDTCFLAEAVGPEGRVIALDAQAEAVAITRQRLEAAGVQARVTLQIGRHEHWEALLPACWRGAIAAVVLNLGYRPGGDKQVVTQAASTCQALTAALDWLAPGGCLSILAYRGHVGGEEEYAAVMRWIDALSATTVEALRCDLPTATSHAPVLLVLRRKTALQMPSYWA
jgi:Putative rRNA methylase